jgi:hypothetical protein
MCQVHLSRLKVTCFGRLWDCSALSGLIEDILHLTILRGKSVTFSKLIDSGEN